MRIEIAKNVMEHLSKFPFGYPTSPNHDEWKLLEVPFSVTDEEGELLCRLMPYSEHIKDIAKRLGRSRSDLLPLLDSLVRKTWVLRQGPKEDSYYQALTWMPGALELQMTFFNKEIIKLYDTMQLPDDPGEVIPHFRVIPREVALPHDVEVLPSEVVSHIIEQAADDEIAVTECICRKKERVLGRSCGAPVEDQCLFLGSFATSIIDMEAGRRISKAEARKRVKRAQELGLVHQANANARPLVICSCCTCCCNALRPLLAGLPQPSLKSNFHSELDMELCHGTCPECIKICPAKAITMGKKNLRPSIELNKCIGCGLCVAACPEKALKLKRKDKPFIYPDTWDHYLSVRAHQSGRTEFYK
jgi:Na+-translocating ferredoxin:NAD+ oxidoreductase subunit B